MDVKLLTDAGVLAGNPGVENGRIVSLVSQSPVGLIWVPFHYTKAEATLFTASQARWSFVWGPQSRVFFRHLLWWTKIRSGSYICLNGASFFGHGRIYGKEQLRNDRSKLLPTSCFRSDTIAPFFPSKNTIANRQSDESLCDNITVWIPRCWYFVEFEQT